MRRRPRELISPKEYACRRRLASARERQGQVSAPSSAGLCPTLAFRLQQTHKENVPSQGASAPVAFEPWASSGLSDQRTERRRDRVDAVSAEGPVLPPGFLGESRGRSPALAHVGQRPPSNQSTRKYIPGRFCFLFFVFCFFCLFVSGRPGRNVLEHFCK